MGPQHIIVPDVNFSTSARGNVLRARVAADEQELDVPTFDGQHVTLELNRDGLAYRIRRRDAILRRFITDGTLATLDGEIVGMTQHILVVSVNEQVLNILMPGR
jgi:hypothetical protein